LALEDWIKAITDDRMDISDDEPSCQATGYSKISPDCLRESARHDESSTVACGGVEGIRGLIMRPCGRPRSILKSNNDR